MVMGGDSCAKGCEFESRHRIMDGHFFTFFCSKNCNMCLKDEAKLKSRRVGPFLTNIAADLTQSD